MAQRRIPLALGAGALALASFVLGGSALAQEAMVGVDAGQNGFLYGSLHRPDGTAGPAPYVLIVPAAAPVDRDGNAFNQAAKPNTYKLLAEALAARGIGSLRIDQRGVGGSAEAMPNEQDLTFDTYVDDVARWAKFLALQRNVKCVALLGHSEGALVAALAAQKTRVCGVIEADGSGRPAGDMIAAQLKAAVDGGRLSQGLYDQATHVLEELRAGRTVSDVPLALDSLFRPSLQPYLISWLNRDPVTAEKGLSPLLVIQGDHDAQIGVDDARRLANISKQAKLVILAGVDHALKPVPAQGAATPDTDAQAPLAPGVTDAVADFVLKLR